MIKISRTEAYSGLDEMDIKVIDQELDSIFQSDQREGKDMTIQYYLEDKKTIVLKVFWDEREVAYYSFKNKGKLTDTAIKKLNNEKERLENAQKLFARVQDNAWKQIEEKEKRKK